ncbi:MAG: protease inhibitor I42 family protein [Actinomycetota bacterium]|nr:protease inhibitor I42 family protein [Actinomycetota bacterium]
MKRHKLYLILLVALAVAAVCLSLVMGGCGCQAEDGEDDGQKVVTEEKKETFNMETAQHVDFTAESNSSTGYTWQTTQAPDENIVRLVNSYYVEPTDQNMVGAPGEEVWQFQAVGAGTTTMVLEYSQAWDEDTPPATRYTLTFNVSQADNEINESFSIQAGQTLSITVDTNTSAGYAWSMTKQPDAKILKLVSSDVSGSGAAGAAEKQVWKFEGVGAGNTSFVLEYKGPGTGAPVEKKDTVSVTVTPAPTPAPTPPKVYNDPNKPVNVSTGEVFILEVTNNSGTNYQWQLAEEINTSTFKFMGSQFFQSGTDPGSAGVTQFTFMALGPGQETIKLGLYEAGDEKPVQEADFNVTVK